MKDSSKTKQTLTEELAVLRRRIGELEQLESERQKAEEALRDAESRYRLLFEHSPDGIVIIDPASARPIEFNETAHSQLGYSREEFAKLSISDFEAVETPEETRATIADVLQNGWKDFETKHRTRQGEIRNAHVTAQITEILGKPVYHCIWRDITERKRAEEELRKTNQTLQAIINASPLAIFTLDHDLRVTTWSPAAERIFGWSSEEAIGRYNPIVPAEKRDEFKALVSKVLSGIAYSGSEVWRQTKDGRQIFVNVSTAPLRDAQGNVTGAMGVIQDITNRKWAEKTLERQNVYLESLNEIALGLMQRTDLKDLFQAIVVRATRFAGADEGWIFVYDSQDGDFEYKAVMGQKGYQIGSRVESGSGISREVWQTEQTVLIDDYHVWPKRAPGREYDMRRATVAIPLKYEGRLAGILGLSHHDAAKRFEKDDLDMLERLAELASIALDNARLYDRMKLELAERKQAEEENLRLAERLQRAEKMEALGTLAGGVAHDLNNVLGIVVGYAELLLNEVDKSSPIRPRLLNIVSGGERAAAIVQDLLTLARRGVPSRQILNLNKLIIDDQHSPQFEMLSSHHPAIRIKTNLEPDLLNISGSPVHLSKTLFNLVSNASEAMPHGGTLIIKTANQHLDKPIHGYDEVREGDYVVLSVSDTGEGIPAADLKHIFEPFYTKKVMGRSGTGLGLSVVWGTVKDHHGYVNVQSKEGQGSTFTLYFPVTREEITAEHAAANISEYMGRGESILVVDDVEGQRNLAAEMLRNLNYRVANVSSGEEAVAYAKEHTIDLIVLDMIMAPGMDGLDTYRSILKICPKQKAIIVSGFSETERVSTAQALGAGAYLRKPYILERLGLAVRKELDRST